MRLGDAVVEIRANLAPFQRALNQAQTEAKRGGAQIAAIYQNASAALAGGVLGLAAMQVVNLSDKFKSLQNELKVTGLAGTDLNKVYAALTASAERNFAPIDALVKLFSSTSQAAKDLGASTGDVLKFTDVVAQALRIAGTSPEAASGALQQLGQMLGSTRTQAEEFNSVADGIRPLMQAAADGIAEAGGSISRLKQLVNDGKISNKAYFEGVLVGSQSFEGKLAGSATTVAGSLQNVQTSLVNLVGEIDGQSGFGDDIVRGFTKVGEAIKVAQGIIADSKDEFAAVGRFLDSVKATVDGAAKAAGRATGLDQVGPAIAAAFDGVEAAKPKVADLETQITGLQDKIKSLSVTPLTILANQGSIEKAQREIAELKAQIDGVQKSAAKPAAPVAVATPGKPKLEKVSIEDDRYELKKDGDDKAAKDAERRAKAVKDMISDLNEEIRVVGLSAAQQEISANLRRVNADAASKEGKQIADLTQKLAVLQQARQDGLEDLQARQRPRADEDLCLMSQATISIGDAP